MLSRQLKKQSGPGSGSINYAALSNLPEQHKLVLIDLINQVWETSPMPADREESGVVRISKAAELPTQMDNMRSISHTCNICKVLRPTVPKPIDWQHDSREALHLMQTEFRAHPTA